MSELLTFEIDEAVAAWARREALEKNTTVSKLIEAILKQHFDEAYRKSYEQWKQIRPIAGIDADNRLSRDEIHDRSSR